MSKVYVGIRGHKGARVFVYDDETCKMEPLPPRNDLWNHSPDGFNWGYGGSGPCQLALALGAHVTGNDQAGLDNKQALKASFTSRIKSDTWMITEQELWAHISIFVI